MAGGQERALRRRIKSVDATKKITRAMELIAATRVVKSQERAAASRPYSVQITNVILDLVRAGAAKDHPLLRENTESDTAAFVAITSDRGLCGAYNSTVSRVIERLMKARTAAGHDSALLLVGSKSQTYFKARGVTPVWTINDVTDRPTYEHAREIAAAIRPLYESGQVATVDLVYWEFLSAGTQQQVTRRLLPLEVPDAEEGAASTELEYEPSPTGILNEILPRYLESRIYSALLDASASEHAARQRAMKAATDNAEDLIVRLSREMNQARQDAITTEIMEIVGGAEALRSAGNTEEADLQALLADLERSA
jgi:F-type H+-transporting ATPase subunit gamma